jgi:hypothetical protein
VDPIHEEDLLIEFVGGGGNEFAKMIAVAEFLEFWVSSGIEFEKAGIFGVDVRERGDFGDAGGFIAEREAGVGFGRK